MVSHCSSNLHQFICFTAVCVSSTLNYSKDISLFSKKCLFFDQFFRSPIFSFCDFVVIPQLHKINLA